MSDNARFGVAVLALLLAMWLLAGCASYPADLRAHEERHCEGWTHTGDAPFYEWTQTRAPSKKPWAYVYVANPDMMCRYMGADAQRRIRSIDACAIWQPEGCVIILPKGAM